MTKITITGFAGSGKTTIAKLLSKKYKIPFLSMGGLRRQIAKENNMTLQELNKLGEKESWTDEIADEKQKKLGKSDKKFIFEGRLSWYFIKNSIKIFFIVKKEVGAKRIYEEKRNSEKRAKSIKEQIKLNSDRVKSDIKRYKKIYRIENCYNPKHFDIFIDTTNLTIKEVYKKTLKEIRKYKLKKLLKLI